MREIGYRLSASGNNCNRNWLKSTNVIVNKLFSEQKLKRTNNSLVPFMKFKWNSSFCACKHKCIHSFLSYHFWASNLFMWLSLFSFTMHTKNRKKLFAIEQCINKSKCDVFCISTKCKMTVAKSLGIQLIVDFQFNRNHCKLYDFISLFPLLFLLLFRQTK